MKGDLRAFLTFLVSEVFFVFQRLLEWLGPHVETQTDSHHQRISHFTPIFKKLGTRTI